MCKPHCWINSIQAVLLSAQFNIGDHQRLERASLGVSRSIKGLPWPMRLAIRVMLSIVGLSSVFGIELMRRVLGVGPFKLLSKFVVGVAAVTWFEDEF